MKIYLDTADTEEIRRAMDTGLLDGVTTNPAKIAQTGRPFFKVIEEICSIVSGPVSAEAVAHSADDIVKKAEEIAGIAENVVIKVPMTADGLRAARILEQEKNIRVNVTMVFSLNQALLAMKTGAFIVSIVLSRLDRVMGDIGLFSAEAQAVKDRYGFTSQILGGSVKTQEQIGSCLRAGLDIITIPEPVFFHMFAHPLTDQGLAEFDEIWKQVREK